MTGRGDFWSRRKAAVAAEAEAERVALEAADEALARDALAEKSDEEVLAELGLKDPDTLEDGDDFAAFLKAAVPERLRRRALRRLWASNPVLANLDGLVDYDDDFTDAATVVPAMQTAYRVGRGMLEHVMKGEAGETPGRATTDRAQNAPVAGDTPDAEPMTVATAAPDDDATRASLTDEGQPPAPAPRRMRFEFS